MQSTTQQKSKNCPKMNVGGQAVIEGVMMRSPRAMSIAVRRANKEINTKLDKWQSVAEKITFLRWPFFRGVIVLIESMINGIQALSFSAQKAMEDEKTSQSSAETNSPNEGKLEKAAIGGSISLAFFVGILLFVVAPHLITELLFRNTNISLQNISFHLVDGVIKVVMFVSYIMGISFFKDIRRVFEYHGAEHKSIFTYEAGEKLTVENAKKYTTLHPRCGTSFIITVLLFSILAFSLVYPFLPEFGSMNIYLKKGLYIFLKIPLLFPIAGISYEFIKLSSRFQDTWWIKLFIFPGLLLQKITTKEPSDDQLEVALESLRAVLRKEISLGAQIDPSIL